MIRNSSLSGYRIKRRITNFFTLPPIEIHPEEYRSFVVFNVGLLAGFLIHLCVTLLFEYLGVFQMVLFNIISLTAYAIGIWCVRRGRFLSGAIIAAAELVIHQALVVYFIGWKPGFQYYILSITGVVFFLPPGRLLVKIAILAWAALGFVFIGRTFATLPPVYSIDAAVLDFMHDFNITAVFFLLGLFASYYSKAAVWSESKLTRSLNLALSSANVGLWEWNIEENELLFSPEWKRQLGYEPNELLNQYEEFESRLHPKDRAKVLEQLNACRKGSTLDIHGEFRLRHRDGTYRWFLSRGRAQQNGNRRVVQVHGCHLDITSLKNSEEALESLARFPAEDPHPVMRISFSGEILYANEASRTLSMDDQRSFPVEIMSAAETSITSEHKLETEIVVGKRTFAVRAVPFSIEKYVNLYLTDISEKKEIEVKMIQQQKFESIGTLAGGIAHDFNNILSSILGYTELALDDVEKNSVMEENLQEVFIAGNRAKELVKQILAFARQSKEEIRPLKIDTIIKEVVKFIRASIPATIEIRQDIHSSSLVMGNPSQVHSILMNLCTNAAHSMEDRGGLLEVALKDITITQDSKPGLVDLKNGNYIELTVSDTGTGIPTEIIDSIFEPYFTTKGPGEGTGLGLAMVHGIVKSYGGQVGVKSSLGKGSVFSVYLPVTQKHEVNSSCEFEPLPHGTEKILLVDDEAAIAVMGRQVLERLGYSVTIRNSSMDALELFRSKPDFFDLVITDMTMPNMTGDRLAAELMKIRPNIPVILCTGYSKQITDDSAKEMGIKAFVYKPIVKSDLAKIVRSVLRE